MLRALHDHIPDVGKEESSDSMILAVFQNSVPAMAVQSGYKHRFVSLAKLVFYFIERSVKLNFLRDDIQALGWLSLYGSEPSPVSVVPVNQEGFPWRIQMEIIPVSKECERAVKHCIYRKESKEQPWSFPLVPAYTDAEINDDERKKLGKEFRKGQRANPAVSEEIGVVSTLNVFTFFERR